MPTIHATASVDPAAALAEDVVVGPQCVIGPRVTLGAGTRLISQVVILGRTTLGQGNTVWPHVTLGGDPQDLKFHGEDTALTIGDHNDIRENVTIHKGTAAGEGMTRIGSENLLMVGCHVAHDGRVGDHCILSNLVQLAGHVHIEDHAIVAGCSAIHHFVTVGSYSLVGGMTRIVHDVPPFMVVEGNPSRVRGVNLVGLHRHRFDPAGIENLKVAYRLLFRGGAFEAMLADGAPPAADLHAAASVAENLDLLADRFPDDPCVAQIIAFVRRTTLGLHGRHREGLRRDDRFRNPVR
jgi:UDP-N-acetylglucosamine acyltransferase